MTTSEPSNRKVHDQKAHNIHEQHIDQKQISAVNARQTVPRLAYTVYSRNKHQPAGREGDIWCMEKTSLGYYH